MSRSGMDDDPQMETPEGIAIVGMACRFPGASSVDAFWENLRHGVESITVLADDELAKAGVPASEYRRSDYVRAAAILEGVEHFDAAFFDIPPREAALMDPQHRLALECAHEALESAGYAAIGARVGVFAGSYLNTYAYSNIYAGGSLAGVTPLQLVAAVDKDYLVTRISYKLDLKGPSIGVQTACSTALVAVHLACQSLLTYECDLALAGAASAKVPQERGYIFSEGNILSPDGHCRPFAAGAGGTVFGNGVGMVALKRLEDALADGDTVHAVIRGSAVNNDGATKIGYTAPSVRGQAEVIATAHACAAVAPETITYIEAHGTGTALGDPVEIAALQEAFGSAASQPGSCALGSVKSNFGHLDVAAGIAGLIKTTLALKHRQIPPSLNFDRPNPRIDFGRSPFFVNTRLAEWRSAGPRRAGVSSFGVGGTNAHVILEEAPPQPPSGPSRSWQLLVLSARTPSALDRAAGELARHLEEHPDESLADAAFTLQVGRRSFDHRRILCCRDSAEAVAGLRGSHPDRVFGGIRGTGDRPLAFLFPGQGSQHAGMGRQLYESEAVFREEVDRCAQLLAPRLGLDLRRVLWPAAGEEAEADRRLLQTGLAQPALFVVEHALARLYLSWGLQPRALAGHSVGEYVAACLAGTFSLPSALGLVAMRGRLMQTLPPGAMLAVPLAEAEVLPLLGGELSLAAVNGPARCVVSGPEAPVERLRQRLEESGATCRRLHTSHAFHSSMMEPILESFAGEVARVGAEAPDIPFLSCVTGTWIEASQATDPEYWAHQLRQPVRFGSVLEELLADPGRILLEAGPGHTLSTLARQHPRSAPERVILSSLPPASEAGQDLPVLLATFGRLWLAGVEPDWSAFSSGERRRRIPLPTYPFERRRHWIEPVPSAERPRREEWKREVGDWFHLPSWKLTLSPFGGAPQEAPTDWLILGDEPGLGAALAHRFRQAGHRAVLVAASAAFDSEGLPDYGTLFAELAAAGVPENVVHLVGCTDAPGWDAFASLLALGKALSGRRGPRQVTVVADGLWRVAAGDRIQPEKALLLGPARVFPWELHGLSCRILDVQPATANLDELAQQLMAELLSGAPEEVVAYRADQRWVPTFEPVRLREQSAPPRRLRPEGVYLITGGLGGVGLELAGYLARTVRARLVLVSRSDRPLQADASRRLRELEAMGAEVLILRADVTDEGQVRAAVEQTLGRFGALHGVIHGAGRAGGELMAAASLRSIREVLAPKVQGTRALAAALSGLPLDFFVLLSSTFSLVGGVGQAAYCAANAFLDAFAQMRAAREPFTLAINWDLWRGTGMAAPRPQVSGMEAAPGIRAGEETGHPLLGRHVRVSADESVYRADLSPEESWVLSDHTLLGVPVLPGVAYLEMARAAFEHSTGQRGVSLRKVAFFEPLAIERGSSREVRTVLRRSGNGFTFAVEARYSDVAGDRWREHAGGFLAAADAAPRSEPGWLAEARLAPGRSPGVTASPGGFIEWGSHWQHVREHPLRDGLSLLELPGEEPGPFALSPSLLDRATSIGLFEPGGGVVLPKGYERLTVYAPLPSRIYVRIERDEQRTESAVRTRDLVILDEGGRVLVEAEGFTLRRIDAAALGRHAASGPGGGGESWRGMPAPEAVDAFGRILGQVASPQIAVSPRDLASIRAPRAAAAPAPGEEHERPDLQTSYAAPGSPVESLAARMFQEVLGFEQVGIHDNFFELGGDSVLALQLVARLRQVGFELAPRQLFENPTPFRLAALLGPSSPAEGAAVPLLPEQLAFFDQPLPADLREASRTILLRARETLLPAALRQALEALAAHHEALRLRFREHGAAALSDTPGALPLVHVDLTGLAAAERERAVAPALDQLSSRFDLGRGPLARAALFDATRLGIAMHPLVADPASWPVLLADLQELYRRAREGGPLLLEQRSATLGRWAERLAAEARSPDRNAELPFWLRETLPAPALLSPEQSGPRGDARSFVSWLDPELSELLVTETAEAFGCQLEELVLAALLLGLGAEGRPVRIDVADSRRREVLPGFEISQTVGALTRIHPLRIDLEWARVAPAVLESVKAGLRRIPDGGIGYGLLRHLAGGEPAEALGARPGAEVLFRPLDTLAIVSGSLFEEAEELDRGCLWDGHLLEARSGLLDGRLALRWSYDAGRVRRGTIESLDERVREALRELVECRPAAEERRYVPADFPQADLDQKELDDLVAELGEDARG